MQVLPTKFESVLRTSDLDYAPLIVKVDADLRKFRKLARYNLAQAAGSLAVIESSPGTGKTTAAYAASVLLKDDFEPVLAIPPLIALPLRDIPEWLRSNLPSEVRPRTTIVLIDGRESTDDEQGLRDVMGALNNLVRGRPDLLFVWPTTDPQWRERLVNTARQFGSASFCPNDGVFAVEGPAKEQWVEAVGLVLEQLGSSWDEFGINESTAAELTANYRTLGDFLTAINQVRVDQEDFSDNVTGLPEVVFVVSSHSRVVSDVARLRNPSNYRLRTDEIIASSRQSEVGKFWRARGARQNTNLAWVSSLLQAKLVSLTPSTVAHACGLEAKDGSRLASVLAPLAFHAGRGSGRTALNTTDLARFLAGQPVPEVLATNKGKTSAQTVEAYDAIQAISGKQHRAINEAILQFVGKETSVFAPSDVLYEVGLGGDAIADAVVPAANRRIYMEFHHVSGRHCSPNKIADYMMRKLRVYATQYNLIER